MGQLASAPGEPQPGFQVWAPHRGFRFLRPAGVSGVGLQSANLGARNQASGEHAYWGCLLCVHSPGAEGGGAPEAEAAVESSLTNC